MKPVFSDKAANRYDAWFLMPSGRYALDLEHALILKLFPKWEKTRVLDVGCGTGNQLLLFFEKGMALGVGVDVSEDMLHYAREKMQNHGVDRIFLLKARAEALPFKANAFNRITSVTALEFFDDPIKAMTEIKRLEAPEYLIAVLNSWSLSSQWRRLKSYFRPNVFRSATFYSPFSLKALFEKNGFPHREWRFQWRTTLHFFPVYIRFLDFLFRAADAFLTYIRSPFGAFLVLKIQKREHRA